MLTPERWQKVRDVLEQAMELVPEKRSRFLDVACSSDPSLRSEVQSLLSADEQARSSFLERPLLQPAALAAGTKLGDYEIVAQIGSGGMGVVYRARDLRLGRDVAIKVLPAHLSSDAARLKRFEQEAKSAAALNHPNILAVHQLGSYQGAPYLVSELLEGETLREVMKGSSLRQPRVMDYAEQIADGLNAAHERGIIHRDLKPENLFVTKDNRVKILDFGLAKLAQRESESAETVATLGLQTHPGMIVGTVGYMSPEQVRGEKLDTRTDLFSFGVVLYEMATGKRPFEGDTSGVTFEAILNRQPTPPTKLNAKVAPGLENIITKALEKDREVRYQHASDIRADLKRLKRDSESGHTAMDASTEPKGRKFTPLGMLGIVGLLAIVIASFLFLWKHNETTVPQAQVSHKQFTFSGNAYRPAISPDGKFVAYVESKTGEGDRLLLQASNGTTLELAKGSVIQHPRWSPDGSELLYHLYAPPGSGEEKRGVFVVSKLGGSPRRVMGASYACWLTADGSKVAGAYQAEAGGFRGYRIANLQSGDIKAVSVPDYALLDGLDCSVDHDLLLLLTEKSDNYQILLYNTDGTGEQKLLTQKGAILSAQFSPAGDAVYYVRRNGNMQELVKLLLANPKRKPEVLLSDLPGVAFSLSANASRLAYTRQLNYSNLWRLSPLNDPGNRHLEFRSMTSGTLSYGTPSFSPDGRWIAFAAGPNRSQSNIFEMPAAGGDRIQLTFFENSSTENPVWSPDGKRLAFVCNCGGRTSVWQISSTGGQASEIEQTDTSNTNNKLAWSPGKEIIFQQPGLRDYLRIDEKLHTKTPILQSSHTKGFVPNRPALSPDGKKLALYWNRSDPGIWVVTLEPYSETLLLADGGIPIGWSPDGKFIFAIDNSSAQQDWKVIKIGLDSPHSVSSIANLPGSPWDYDAGSVNPNGRDLAVSIEESKSDIWIMEDFDPAEAQAVANLRSARQ